MCTKPLRHFAVIGHPIGHTMSPFIHERLFALAQKEPSEYLALDIPPAGSGKRYGNSPGAGGV